MFHSGLETRAHVDLRRSRRRWFTVYLPPICWLFDRNIGIPHISCLSSACTTTSWASAGQSLFDGYLIRPWKSCVYEHQLYFWNDGCLPDDWTVERLHEKHPSRPYNPLIANAFFRTGQIEAWGRGIEKVAAVCRQAGLDPPTYRMDANGLMVHFTRQADAHGGVNEGVTRSKAERGGVNEGVKAQVAPESEGLGEGLGESPRRILTILKQHPQTTIPELSDQLEISTTAIEKNIARLKKKGYLERIGGARHGHWHVK